MRSMREEFSKLANKPMKIPKAKVTPETRKAITIATKRPTIKQPKLVA